MNKFKLVLKVIGLLTFALFVSFLTGFLLSGVFITFFNISEYTASLITCFIAGLEFVLVGSALMLDTFNLEIEFKSSYQE